jgi:hypothetical protein
VASPFVARFDLAYTVSRHTVAGRAVQKDLARGRDAHVFLDGTEFEALEMSVWRNGFFIGRVGAGQRSNFERFVWQSDVAIGRRIQPGREDVPLYWVEIKGQTVGNEWVYHVVPRARPPA